MLAYVLRFFMGDGTSGKYFCKSGLKYQWYLCNKDLDLLKRIKQFCDKVFEKNKPLQIYNTLKSSNVYKM